MSRFILLIALSCLLLTSGTCKKEEGEPPPYFECDYYHYFPDDGFPVLTPEDSAATAEFLVNSGTYSRGFLEWKANEGYVVFSFLPYIKNTIDTALFNRYLRGVDRPYRLKPIYKSLNWFHLYAPIMSDAVFIGTVVDRRYIRDSTQCLWYGIRNVYRVDEVLHARFPLKKGDYLLESRDGGYSGGCTPAGQEEVFTSTTHEEAYTVGSKQLFRASRQAYASFFIGQRYLNGKYMDEYCPNMFNMLSHNWNADQIKDMKLFCKEHFK